MIMMMAVMMMIMLLMVMIIIMMIIMMMIIIKTIIISMMMPIIMMMVVMMMIMMMMMMVAMTGYKAVGDFLGGIMFVFCFVFGETCRQWSSKILHHLSRLVEVVPPSPPHLILGLTGPAKKKRIDTISNWSNIK